MKFSGREAARFIAKPDPSLAGMLIYGEDGVEVAERRAGILAALLGGADDDMRLSRIDAGEARRRPGALIDEMKARSFFDGRRVVLIEGAADGAAAVLSSALAVAEGEDAFLLVTAGALPVRSRLRKAFEGSANAAATPCYGDPPGRDEVRRRIEAAGVGAISDDGLQALEDLARGVDRGAFADLTARLALYAIDAAGPVSAADVAACAPPLADADLDGAINAAAEGRAGEIGPMLSRLAAQGKAPTAIAIAVTRRFRMIHAVRAAPASGVEKAVGALRPPVYGPRRDALIRQCRLWSAPMAEEALREMMTLELSLRGPGGPLGRSLLERVLLRLALKLRR